MQSALRKTPWQGRLERLSEQLTQTYSWFSLKMLLPRPILLMLAITLTLLSGPVATASARTVLDAFDDPAVWRAIDGSPAAQPTTNGLAFTLPFQTGRDRVYWDRDGVWDFSSIDAFELDLTCDDPSALRAFSLYFRSGDGWYIWSHPLPSTGRQILQLTKADFKTEGAPTGWTAIDKIRLSPWKGREIPATLTAHRLSTRTDRLFIVQANRSAPNDTERAVARRATERICRWIRDAGLRHAVIDEDRLTAITTNASLIVLPYNPKLPPGSLKALRAFTKRGGKLVVFYSSDDQLARLMDVKLGTATNTRDIARWRGMAFTSDAPPGLPPVVHQQSWNIGPARPAAKTTKVIAWWVDAAGHASKDAAVLASPHGFWFTHIFLDDDQRAKQRMLTGLLASLDPALWTEAANHALLEAGRVDSWRDAPHATASIAALAVDHADRETLEAFSRRITHLDQTLEELHTAGRHREATLKGYDLTDVLIQAYGLAQSPAPGEFRAVWDHDATGWFPGDWDRTARLMADSGINALFVNATWAGLAHYPSQHLPGSFTLQHYGDQLAAAIQACRQHGIEVHAWIVCWILENARPEFTDPLRGGERLQHSRDGRERLWMNPAHPDNRQHHLAVIDELLARYPLDGIHLDYIRYPDSSACYAPYTRNAFTNATGLALTNWPADVEPGGPHRQAFTQWRADIITTFVREVRDRMKTTHPEVRLSAAVWGGYPQVINSIGQDWGHWLQEDLVDFVTPMNYAPSLNSFTALLDPQLRLPAARGRIIPGLGVTANESQLRGDQVIEQILALRERGVKGFALFDLSQSLVDEILPALRIGVTRN